MMVSTASSSSSSTAAFKSGVLLGELFDVALEGAAEGHHVDLFAVRPDLDDLPADERVRAFPDREFSRWRRRFGCPPAPSWLCLSPLARRRVIWLRLPAAFFSRGNLQRHGVVVFLLEVFRDGAEIEQEEILLLVFGVADLEREQPRAAPFDLDVFGRRKDRPHEADIEQVAAVVAGREHVHRDGDALGALAVAKLLGDGRGILNARRDRDGNAGLKLVEDFRQGGRVGLIHREDDRLAELPGWVSLRFLQERLAHDAIAGGRENLSLQGPGS